MPEELNKALARRFFEEVWNQQKENVIDELSILQQLGALPT